MNVYKPTLTERVTNFVVRALTNALCIVDADQLKRIPTTGPLIAVTNHINFLDAPVVYTRLMPRSVTGYSKIESWDSASLGWLFDVWNIIPIRRGEPDKTAVKRGLRELKEGAILTIAPEGTRSHDGRLQRGHPGVVLVALLSGAPLQPVVHYGHEDYRKSLRKLRRSDFHLVVGDPFRLEKHGAKATSEVRQRMADEIMYQMAALLPADYRGVYSDLSQATENYLHFTPPARSNLPQST
jgi:1-acyl-sn-glycerol-3-phosphate acyltransferase